jgi:hypothetical protein
LPLCIAGCAADFTKHISPDDAAPGRLLGRHDLTPRVIDYAELLPAMMVMFFPLMLFFAALRLLAVTAIFSSIDTPYSLASRVRLFSRDDMPSFR